MGFWWPWVYHQRGCWVVWAQLLDPIGLLMRHNHVQFKSLGALELNNYDVGRTHWRLPNQCLSVG